MYTLGRDAQIVWDSLRAIDPNLVCFDMHRPIGSNVLVFCDPVNGLSQQMMLASTPRLKNLIWNKTGKTEFVDQPLSPVIEWLPSRISGGVLRKGRLYMVSYYFSDEGKTRKDESFVAESARMFSAVKRKLSRLDDLDGYFGPEARSFVLSMDQPREVSNAIVPSSEVKDFVEQEARRIAEALRGSAKTWSDEAPGRDCP